MQYNTNKPMSSSYAIPKILWESLESALYAESRNLVRNIADTLHVPQSDLLKAVFPTKEDFKVTLYDTDSCRECLATEEHPLNNDLAIRCRNPVFPGETFCKQHKYTRNSLQLRIEPAISWTPLKVPPELPPLWTDGTGAVFNVKREQVGYLQEDTLIMIDIDGGT